MKIWVNKEQQQYSNPLTLQELLVKLDKADKQGIAVAINNSVIPKQNWLKKIIEYNDRITIISATQGG